MKASSRFYAFLGVAFTLLSAFGTALGMILEEGDDGPIAHWDATVGRALGGSLGCGSLVVTVSRVLVYLGIPPWFYLLIGATCIYFALGRRFDLSSYLLVATLGGGAIDTIVKRVVDRPRPEGPRPCDYQTFSGEGWSFPSGHSMTSVIAYGALAFVILPRLSTRVRPVVIGIAVALPLLIGLGRLALGVHHLSDIVGGWLLGAAWLAASTWSFKSRYSFERDPSKSR